ncbi:MAG: hypothetical protein DHS20C15_27130 [Planctomycetota bacterium]|nr:MAG: hypothetical protein DHS20C15_27130 [Planctomycetota bacterium]
MNHRSLLRVAFLAALFLGFSQAGGSCVQFDGQHVRVHVDAERDRLDLQIVYRDLHATQSNLDGALTQLDQLRAGQRWFALISNWPFMLNMDSVLADPPEAGSTGAALLTALDTGLQVRPGELWTDEQGRLCASQLVRLQGLDTLVAAINGYLLSVLDDAKLRTKFLEDLGVTDSASHALFDAAIQQRSPLLERRGASFAFTLPVNDAGFAQLARRFLVQLDQADTLVPSPAPLDDPSATELDQLLEWLAANDLALERRRDRISLVLGDPTAAEWAFVTPPTARPQPGSLGAALAERGWTIHGPEHEERVNAAFAAFVSEP